MLRGVIALLPRHRHRQMSNDEPKQNPAKLLLKQIIDSNGGTPSIEKDRALWIVLDAIWDDVAWLKDKVLILERESIISWVRLHKAETAGVVIFLAVAIMAWHDAYPELLRYLELLAPLKSTVK